MWFFVVVGGGGGGVEGEGGEAWRWGGGGGARQTGVTVRVLSGCSIQRQISRVGYIIIYMQMVPVPINYIFVFASPGLQV